MEKNHNLRSFTTYRTTDLTLTRISQFLLDFWITEKKLKGLNYSYN